jgi:S1-C subfamily serine protease
MGSSVAIRSDAAGTDLLTDAHVIMNDAETAPADGITVTVGDSKVPAKVVKVDVKADIALLHVSTKLPTMRLLEREPIAGELELVIGYPLADQETATLGYIGAMDPKTHYLGASGAVLPGNSGGGAFVLDGGEWRLAGLAESVRQYTMPQSRLIPVPAFAAQITEVIPVGMLMEFLNGPG